MGSRGAHARTDNGGDDGGTRVGQDSTDLTNGLQFSTRHTRFGNKGVRCPHRQRRISANVARRRRWKASGCRRYRSCGRHDNIRHKERCGTVKRELTVVKGQHLGIGRRRVGTKVHGNVALTELTTHAVTTRIQHHQNVFRIGQQLDLLLDLRIEELKAIRANGLIKDGSTGDRFSNGPSRFGS